jgi:hypothetical protein
MDLKMRVQKMMIDQLLSRSWGDENIRELPTDFISVFPNLIDSGAYDDVDERTLDCIFLLFVLIHRNAKIPRAFDLKVLERFRSSFGVRQQIWMNIMFNSDQPEISLEIASLLSKNPALYVSLCGAWVRPMLRIQQAFDDSEKIVGAMIIQEAYNLLDDTHKDLFVNEIEKARMLVSPNDFSIYKFIPNVNTDATSISH